MPAPTSQALYKKIQEMIEHKSVQKRSDATVGADTLALVYRCRTDEIIPLLNNLQEFGLVILEQRTPDPKLTTKQSVLLVRLKEE